MQPHSLEGRAAIVTGASRGIGAAIAGALDRAGARIALGAIVADVVTFLASDAARFVTRETVCMNGGLVRTTDLYGGPV